MQHGDGTGTLACRAIRGATTSLANTAEDMLEATDEMLRVLIALNDLKVDEIVSVIFTTTPDLNATFPAISARNIGWSDIPLLCSHEMNVAGALQSAVRALIHVNTTKSAAEIRHVYLKGAKALRPEWAISDGDVQAALNATTVAR